MSSSTICGTAAHPLVEPEALQLTHTAPALAGAPTAGFERATGINGSGVTVVQLSDGGANPSDPDLQRDGSPVLHEVDFSGSGTVPENNEGYADVSAVVAQGTTTYDLASQSGYRNPAIGAGCDIRSKASAGRELDALSGIGSSAEILAAIDYAVGTLHVNVLNESFGGLPVPDTGRLVELADEQAYEAGVTVVVSSGDSGPYGTIGVPATDNDVLTVGSSTDFGGLAQTAGGGAGLASLTPAVGFQGGTEASPDGWDDNSPSAFSSAGRTSRTECRIWSRRAIRAGPCTTTRYPHARSVAPTSRSRCSPGPANRRR